MPKLLIKKIDKGKAGYLYRPGSLYTCEECVFFENGTCLMYKGDNKVDPKGSCILWQKEKNNLDLPKISTATKEGTAYEVQANGFSCGRCEYWLSDKQDCKKVKKDSIGDTPGKILGGACCNFWSKK